MVKRFDMRVSLAVCFAAMISGAVAHAEPGSTIDIMGSGQYSCGKFIGALGDLPPGKYREKSGFVSENKAYTEWLMGFVMGYSAAHGGDLKTDPAGLDLWMRNWCNKHPTQTVAQGAVAFITEMLTNAARKQ